MKLYIKYVALLLFIVLIVCASGCVKTSKLSRSQQKALMYECLQDANDVYLKGELWWRGGDRSVAVANIAAAFFEHRAR